MSSSYCVTWEHTKSCRAKREEKSDTFQLQFPGGLCQEGDSSCRYNSSLASCQSVGEINVQHPRRWHIPLKQSSALFPFHMQRPGLITFCPCIIIGCGRNDCLITFSVCALSLAIGGWIASWRCVQCVLWSKFRVGVGSETTANDNGFVSAEKAKRRTNSRNSWAH